MTTSSNVSSRRSDPPLKNDEARRQRFTECGVGADTGAKLGPSGARVVHCKRAPFDVYIGRACHGFAGSKWGNPFKVPKGYDLIKDPDRILKKYEDYLLSRPELVAALPELRGKVLGCWCAPKPCHGDVLLRLANA